METLKPCPFCGCKPKLQESIKYTSQKSKPKREYAVVCENWYCPIYLANKTRFLSQDRAVEVWNSRYVEGGQK